MGSIVGAINTGAPKIRDKFWVYQIVFFSNIAIAIFNFSLLILAILPLERNKYRAREQYRKETMDHCTKPIQNVTKRLKATSIAITQLEELYC